MGDYETNLAKSNITLKVEYSTVPRSAFKYDTATDRLTYTVPRKKRLSYGYTDVQMIAKDPQRLIGKESWYFCIVRP